MRRAQFLTLLVSVPALTASPGRERLAAGIAPEPIRANANRTSAGRLRSHVLTVTLELRTGLFHPYADDGPGVLVQAFGEPGRPLQIPGPLVRVAEGTVIEATVRNTLHDSTLVVYGLQSRPGRPDDSIQIKPRSTRTVRFPAGKPGTYFYWGTTTSKQLGDDRWLDSQLHGALIVDPAHTSAAPDERVFVLGLWLKPADSARSEPAHELMTINGKAWPFTERLTYAVGDTVRWRWINPTSSSHPMHLHGFYFDVRSRGGWAADTLYAPVAERRVVTELLWPGGTMAARWTPSEPGNWVFHCHFAFHVSNELYLTPKSPDSHSADRANQPRHGMSGLVLGLHVNPAAGAPSAHPSHAAEPQRFRLIARAARAPADSAHLFGYVLQHDGTPEPVTDSLPIPGPALVLERGRPTRITVVNRLSEPTAVHWHGIELGSYPDGVPDWSGVGQRVFRAIAPGDSFVAEFIPPRAGTFMYHSHFSEVRQILGGLYGPLIVINPGVPLDTATNRLVIVGALLRNDSTFGVINGRLDPTPIILRAQRTYRFRLFNIGDARTSFALRGMDSSVVAWRAVAKDGADLPADQAVVRTDPLMTGPGEIADFEFTPGEAQDLVLDVNSPFVPWQLSVPIQVLADERAAVR
jgi:FtsP/CotA-like multicopper oxidase with cupredoxin domain